jgi:4-amino-4-deoxy-L-arabinose transferase-like glycosyltransferase
MDNAVTPPDPPAAPPASPGRWALVIGVLAMTLLLMRATALSALPIFGDEAIYLRWAQLIRGDGVAQAHPWISLADPKPPLHYWLIAWVFHWAGDPLVPARLLSVLAGVVSVPLLFSVCGELGHLVRNPGSPIRPSGKALGLLAVLLMIFCPFLSFYQRLATADALFVCESLAIVWLSLRWGRAAATRGAAGRWGVGWGTAAGLGFAIAVALMTRQGLSYTLCAMPVAAWLLHLGRGTPAPSSASSVGRPFLLKGVLQLLLAALLAAVLWTPYLTAELRERTLEFKREAQGERAPQIASGDLIKEVKRRILYQDKFTSGDSRGAVARRNFQLTFLPRALENGRPTPGWLYLYLTPLLYLTCLLGVIYLAWVRQWALLAVLLLWLGVTLGPPVLLGNVIFSRYVLAGTPPLLIAGAYLLAELFGWLFVRFERRQGVAWLGMLLILFAVLALPIREIGLQATQWRAQALTPRDNYQYVSGWTSGLATRRALLYLRGLADIGPLVVITNNGWGTPADAVWVYLSPHPNVTLYYTDHADILSQTAPGTYSVRSDKWLYPPYTPTRFPDNVPVLYVTSDQATSEEVVRKGNPNLGSRETFKGTGDPDGNVSVYQVRTVQGLHP